MQKITNASLFDLDHTLFKENSSFQFALFLYRKKMFSLFDLLTIFSYKCLFFLNLLSLEKLHILVFQRFFKGKESSVIELLAKEFVADYFKSLVYKPAIRMLTEAKINGHYTVILSSSPSFIVEPVANQLFVNEWEASSYDIDKDGRYSSVKEIVSGRTKKQFVQNFIIKHKISRENIAAYSDSMEDLPFLESVGIPVAVNPDKTLKRVCRRKNWRII